MLKDRIVSLFLAKANINKLVDITDANLLFKMVYKYFAQRLIDFNFPHHIFLEATNSCNLRCDTCARNTSQQELGFMDFSLFRKVVDEAASYGSRNFCLHIFGEPLLAPNIIRMLHYIKEKNKENVILLTTNATLMDKKIAEEILAVGVDRLVVSLIAAGEQAYQEITKANFLSRAEENTINLMQLKRLQNKSKPLVYVRMLKNPKTAAEEKLFCKKWSQFNCIIDIRDAHNYSGKVAPNTLKKLPKVRYPCYHLWFSPAVNFDGEVSICCCDWAREAVIGNLREDSLAEIWQGNLLRQFRLYHLQAEYNEIPLCRNCDVWSTYPDIFFRWQKAKKKS